MENDKLTPWLGPARDFTAGLRRCLELNTVILDDWAGIRLIYESADVARCDNRCQACPTRLALGVDGPDAGLAGLATTLRPDDGRNTTIRRNRMLNCKTMADYQESFVQWLLTRCATDRELHDELDLVFGFRVVFDRHAGDDAARLQLETSLKQGIIDRAASLASPDLAQKIREYCARKWRHGRP